MFDTAKSGTACLTFVAVLVWAVIAQLSRDPRIGITFRFSRDGTRLRQPPSAASGG
jgi:hypothetical protein